MTRSVKAVLVAMAVCLCLPSFAAPRRGGMEPMSTMGPDLVVQEIIIREEGSAEFHSARVDVRVRNIGGANAGETVTVLVYSNNATSGAIVLTEDTPAIAKGAYHDVEFVIEGIAGKLSGMLLAVADAPIGPAPTGQVTEGKLMVLTAAGTKRTDLNNTFGVIFSTSGRTLPMRFQNPLVQ